MATPLPITSEPGLDQALELHRAGQFALAKSLYEAILRAKPQDFDALQLMGALHVQMSEPAKAVEVIGRALALEPDNPRAYAAHGNLGAAFRLLNQFDVALVSHDRAIALNPEFAEAYSNRGKVYADLKRLEEALDDYDCAIRIRPRFAEAHLRRARVLQELERFDAALEAYDVAIALRPEFATAHAGRGNLLMAQQRLQEALASYDRAVVLRPDYAEAYANRGNVLRDLKQLRPALASYDTAININPNCAEAYCNRGNVLLDLVELYQAVDSFDRAIAIRPGYAAAHLNRGNALLELRRFTAALQSYDQAIALQPQLPEAHLSRGNALAELRQLDAAVDSYDRAIALRSDYARAYVNRAMVRLLSGDWERGWDDYEWRWRAGSGVLRDAPRPFAKPRWLGNESIRGKTILLHAEGGFGDTLQFCRYAKLVADLGARVVLEVQASLVSLLATLEGTAHVFATGSVLPDHDYQCPLMSLPSALRGSCATIPAPRFYLRADPDKVELWRKKLGEKNKPRIGLVWSGGFTPDHSDRWALNYRRNIPLSKLAPLNNPALEFHSLQKGPRPESELRELVNQQWNGPALIDHTRELNDFSDTAALMANLDLIISVDTATAHLAGALGRPVWLLNRYDTCWRWLLHRKNSPWYPSMRIYRQPRDEDWDGVVREATADLSRFGGAPSTL